MPLDRDELTHLLRRVQDDVVARHQLPGLGATAPEVRRLLRRGELVVVLPGVYVGHNGPLSWRQRAWAAVLHHEPAALTGRSALPGEHAGEGIHVAVGHHRTLQRVPGVLLTRTQDLAGRLHPRASPPRLRLEHAVLDAVAPLEDPAAQLHLLAEACRTRTTTPAAIAAALRGRRGIRGAALLLAVLDDLATGAASSIERSWLHLERRHALPVGERQAEARVAGERTAFRDVRYRAFRTIVELDGRLHHHAPQAWDDDHERDLAAAAASDAVTLRLTHGMLLGRGRGCRTVARVAEVLQRRGW